MTEAADGGDLLRSAYRGRMSRQRLRIAEVADGIGGIFSAEDLLSVIRGKDSCVGVATVYRALAAMADAGFVEQVGVRNGAALYARCRTTGHHHHLVCTECGRVEETSCGLARTIAQASAHSGFKVTRHEFNLFGVCAACSRSVER